MIFDYQIYRLSEKFMEKYPLSNFPELMYKNGRPYNCVLIDSHNEYFICIPYRTSINHNNAYHFRQSARSKLHKSGLDYSKIVIIKDSSLLSSDKAIIDDDEYNETIMNIDRITEEALQYVDTYISHINGTHPLHGKDYERSYRFSTLKYFHQELGIN